MMEEKKLAYAYPKVQVWISTEDVITASDWENRYDDTCEWKDSWFGESGSN